MNCVIFHHNHSCRVNNSCTFCRLYVVKGKPNEVFPKLFKHWGVSHLTFEEDTEPYAVSRDSEIQKIAKEHNVEVTSCVSHTLFDTQRFVENAYGL